MSDTGKTDKEISMHVSLAQVPVSKVNGRLAVAVTVWF